MILERLKQMEIRGKGARRLMIRGPEPRNRLLAL